MNISGIGYRPTFKSIAVEDKSFDNIKDPDQEEKLIKELKDLGISPCKGPGMKDYTMLITKDKATDDKLSSLLSDCDVKHKVVGNDPSRPEYMFNA